MFVLHGCYTGFGRRQQKPPCLRASSRFSLGDRVCRGGNERPGNGSLDPTQSPFRHLLPFSMCVSPIAYFLPSCNLSPFFSIRRGYKVSISPGARLGSYEVLSPPGADGMHDLRCGRNESSGAYNFPSQKLKMEIPVAVRLLRLAIQCVSVSQLAEGLPSRITGYQIREEF